MKSQGHAIKAMFGRFAPIDEWQFIADASRDLVIRAVDIEGRFVERLTLAITTSAQSAGDLVEAASGDISRHWWWEVESVAGSVYGLSARTPAVSSTNGLLLVAGDRIGPTPEREAAILRQLLLSASALDTNIIKHNGTEYQVTRAVVSLTATAAIVPATASKYGVLLELEIIPIAGVSDTYRLSDGTIDLLGSSSCPIPLSADGTSSGAAGYTKSFPFGLKTSGVNKDITCTIGSGGDAAVRVVYALTTD